MRQAGILAAAGIYALEHHVARLAEDHANAAFLADGLRALGFAVEPPQTNILYVNIASAEVQGLARHLAAQGIIASVAEHTRLVTHLDVTRADLQRVIETFDAYRSRAAG
jgi:threonine aldolase